MTRFLIGFVCLVIAVASFSASLGMLVFRIIPDVPGAPAWPVAIVAAFFAIAGFLLWRSAYVRAPETDEVFAGERGLLLSLMLVSTLFLAAFMTVMIVQPDFWRGLIDGLSN